MLGFEERLDEVLSGEHVEQIHFETRELAKSSMATLPSIPAFTIEAATVAALEDLEVEPDVILVAVSPGMVNRIMDASLWYTGGPYTTSYGSISGICASATAKAYISPSRYCYTNPSQGIKELYQFIGSFEPGRWRGPPVQSPECPRAKWKSSCLLWQAAVPLPFFSCGYCSQRATHPCGTGNSQPRTCLTPPPPFPPP